jgi:hypothetical protein
MGTVALLGLAVGGLLIWAAWAKFKEMRSKHGMHNLIFRALTMRPLRGHRRTDATFFRQSTDRASGKSRGRHHRAGWHNLLISLGVIVGLAATLYGLVHNRFWTLAGLAAAALAAAALGVIVGVRRGRTWHRNRAVIAPLAVAAETIIDPDRSLSTHRGSMITMAPDWLTRPSGELGVMTLPDSFHANPAQREALEGLISARLPRPVQFGWRTDKMPQQVRIMARPPMPSMVPLASVMGELQNRKPHMIYLGRDASGQAHWWDRSQEDPHAAVHGGSRRGKTSLLLSIASQELAGGGRVTAIDPKRVSLVALSGIPGVTLLSDPRDVHGMWDGVAGFHAMILDRFEGLSADPTLEFAHELLMIDEVSMFAGMSRQVWQAEKGRSDPALPPVWNDLAGCVWLGAQVHAHVVVAGQRLDYAVLGGMLGSFGIRLLAGYGPTDYARLVGVPPYVKPQKPRGRFLLFEGGELNWLQLVFAEPDEWRDYARRRRALRQRPAIVPAPDPGGNGQRPVRA